MKKIICVLLMSLIALTFASNRIFAADSEVTYDGNQLSITEDLKSFEHLLPGESIEVEITVRNKCKNKTDWYVSNEALKSFEDGGGESDSTKADSSFSQGGGYEYKLTYNNKTIYDSERVGGQDTEGLKELNETDGKYFYLGTLSPKGEGTVKMTLVLDGESQANDYEEALAQLQLSFAVEEEIEEVKKIKFLIPTTGVEGKASIRNDLDLYYAIFSVSMLVMTACVCYLIYDRKAGERA